jgi:MFS family permease
VAHSDEEHKDSLSHDEIRQNLRIFITSSGLWSAWSQMAGAGSTVLIGYALSLGANASFFALFASVRSLTGMAQFLSPLIGHRIRDHKRFILLCRVLACVLRAGIVAIPFFFASALQPGALLVLVSISLFCMQAANPFYGGWQASVIPANIRARFTSRYNIVSTLVGMVVGYLVGLYIDAFTEADKQLGFTYLFSGSTVVALASIWVLRRASFPRPEPPPLSGGGLKLLRAPFKDANFRRALLFYGSWQFAQALADPFYSIFMLERLQISYTTISVYSILAMITSIVGMRLWAAPIDRYGSKAIMTLLVVPHMVFPLLWAFSPARPAALIPLVMGLSGFFSSGFSLCITALVYGLLPEGDQKSTYMGCWAATASLIYALGNLIGGLLTDLLAAVHLDLWGLPLDNIQIVFLLRGVMQIVPLVLLRFVPESQGGTLREWLTQSQTRVREMVRQRRMRNGK